MGYKEFGEEPDEDGLTPKELATKSQKETVVAIMDDFEKHRSSASALTARTPHAPMSLDHVPPSRGGAP